MFTSLSLQEQAEQATDDQLQRKYYEATLMLDGSRGDNGLRKALNTGNYTNEHAPQIVADWEYLLKILEAEIVKRCLLS
jgi:hypothetical protein